MRILISNDDGVYSPGLEALADVASRFGEVRVVAPDVEQSSMGHALRAPQFVLHPEKGGGPQNTAGVPYPDLFQGSR